jgi:hypothetical protein
MNGSTGEKKRWLEFKKKGVEMMCFVAHKPLIGEIKQPGYE